MSQRLAPNELAREARRVLARQPFKNVMGLYPDDWIEEAVRSRKQSRAQAVKQANRLLDRLANTVALPVRIRLK